MNHVYQLVWSEARGQYVVASEHSRSQGRKGRGATVVAMGGLLAGLLGMMDASAVDANALPTSGTVTAGAATLATSGATLNVNQTSDRAAINWQSFSVGSNATVNFNQPNASAVTLNRVVGNEASVIAGALNANGQVFVLNSNGVLFAQGAQVTVGGIVASTLNMSDADFLAGRTTLTSTGSRASVINQGTITTADGGYAALVGNQVKNQGVIVARLGTAALAAGDKVSLNFNGNSLVGVAIEQGTLNALVENGNAIRADGGLVVLTAKGLDTVLGSLVNNTGEVRAQTVANKDGKIYLLGGMEHGTVKVAGTLDASAPTGGKGGFIETSAAKVQIADSARVTTRAPAGESGTWLIDPTDFTISAGTAAQTASGIGAGALQTALGNGNVIIQTQSAGTEDGNINVNAAVAWSANKLTLEAHGDINVNAVMSATGTSTLDMKTGYNFDQNNPAYDASKVVRMGMTTNASRVTSFTGRVDFDRAGTGLLTINGEGYTLVNALGAAGSTTGTDLQGMAGALTGKFALAGNIDASATSGWNAGAGFTPVGDWSTSQFTGEFNGLGHTITGMTINRPASVDPVGLFGSAGDGVGLSNVGIVNASITGKDFVGALAGEIVGTAVRTDKAMSINNVFTSGTVTGTGTGWSYVGGVVGAANIGRYDTAGGWISDVVSSVNVTSAGTSAGGAFGMAFDQRYDGGTGKELSLTRLRAYGNVTSTKAGRTDTGGLIGYFSEATLTDSFAMGTVQGGDYTGGLVGLSDWMSMIERSYAAGTSVTGGSDVGGLVGGNFGTIQYSYATANVTGSASGSRAGGLVGRQGHVGWNVGATTNSSYARGSVTGGDMVGGLIGYLDDDSIINDAYSTGAVTGTGHVGGSIGGRYGVITAQNKVYWDKQTSGQNADGTGGIGGHGFGVTTAAMKNVLTFLDPNLPFFLNWDIVADPALPQGRYPELRWVANGATAGSSVWVIGTGAPTGTGGGQQADNVDRQVVAAIRTPGSITAPQFSVRQPEGTPATSAFTNVVNLPASLMGTFSKDDPLAVLASPRANEPTQSVSLSDARKMLAPGKGGASGSDREVRVPVSRNSIAEIVNGGVKLPAGVEQQLFVVKAN